MPTIVDFPAIVQKALATFRYLFDTEPARRHFAEYLTGLIVAENKTVSGINREFVVTTDQSCLNRWLTEVSWDVQALNDRRYWYFSKQMRIPDVDHPVRVLMFWKERDDEQSSKALVSKRVFWEVLRMTLVYRHRWTGPRPSIGTASSSWAWEIVRCAPARVRPATCISSA